MPSHPLRTSPYLLDRRVRDAGATAAMPANVLHGFQIVQEHADGGVAEYDIVDPMVSRKAGASLTSE
jgi:hypothetical protein